MKNLTICQNFYNIFLKIFWIIEKIVRKFWEEFELISQPSKVKSKVIICLLYYAILLLLFNLTSRRGRQKA